MSADTVRKSVLVLKPLFNVAANRCAIRTLLIDRGFVIVREEERLIVGDAKAAILGDGSAQSADERSASNNAECAVYVVARADAVLALRQLLADNMLTDADAVTPQDDASAANLLSTLFPRMKRDVVPSSEHSAEYLDLELKALLVKGLTDLAKAKPVNPVEALAHWLLEHNPHRGPAQQPAAASSPAR